MRYDVAVWGSDDAHAATLLTLGVDRYGADAVGWEPETWRHEVAADCGVELPDGNLNRLMSACLHLREPDAFYQQPARFELLCRMFHSVPGFRAQYEGHADLTDVAWGCLEAVVLHPPDHPWSAAVTAYVRAACLDAGVETPPSLLGRLGLKIVIPPGETLDPSDPTHATVAAGRHAASAEVADAVRDGCARLARQLAALPLRHGDAKPLAAKLTKLAGRPQLIV